MTTPNEPNKARTIPLHIADQAVAACEAEIQKLKEENAQLKHKLGRLLGAEQEWTLVEPEHYARLKAEVEELTNDANEADQQYEHAISRVRRLEAEVERLTQEYSDATNHYNKLHNDLQAEVERLQHQLKLCGEIEVLASFSTGKSILLEIFENKNLKAEVERLRKAGDELSNALAAFHLIHRGRIDTTTQPDIVAWNAAKEGKPSV